MKDDGSPDTYGEVRSQAGATATTVKDESGQLVWAVRRARDGHVFYTAKLAHATHWKLVGIGLPPAPGLEK
jgi:hypothetical protein